MSYLRRSRKSAPAKATSLEEQQAKINEVRKLIGSLADRIPNFCSDACISRYLRARNWSAEKASKMLKETVKWRLEYKPESIRWDDISHEAETGKIYRADYVDKYGRAVLVMRPGFQNTTSTEGQIKYLVYCMENAILSLTADQEQMVWLIDFQGWTMASVSVKVTRETAHVLQDYYPERLGLGILYNPPRIFESFWKIVKPFLDHKTYKKVKFVYSDDTESQKIMTDLFDVDKLESAFGGRNPCVFDFDKYAERMREDDKKMDAFLNSGGSLLSQEKSLSSLLQKTESSISEALSEASSEDSFSSATESPKQEGIKSHSENGMQEHH
ncbi:random slug protein 5-like isoform X1 [Ananas comosus]|uniref:Random slug protein 5-like isoform X1 n=1 Tax=Ananas comosus TaxID=4615 RepID=A0A6P5GJN2_ANACO|nr:random slug protein 5-like isoform X1 [Ananas comosus]